MKHIFTTKQILNLVNEPWKSVRKFMRNEDGIQYELQISRLGTVGIWIWACETYIKPTSKAFAYWNGKEWKQKRNKFVKIIHE